MDQRRFGESVVIKNKTEFEVLSVESIALRRGEDGGIPRRPRYPKVRLEAELGCSPCGRPFRRFWESLYPPIWGIAGRTRGAFN
jgi:hypothetical protein